MAHTLFAMRAPLHVQERFTRELSTRYLPYDVYNPETKKMEKMLFEFRLCPITLWDACYPKQFRDAVHTTMFMDNKGGKLTSSFRSPILNLPLAAIRKATGMKPIAPYKTDAWLPMDFPKGAEIIGIGEKDDYWIEPDGRHVSEKDKSEFAREGL